MTGSNRLRHFLADNFIWVLVVVFLVAASLWLPRFFTSVNFTNMLYHTAAISMMILGMSFCLLANRMDLSIESTFAIAPTIGVLFVTVWVPGLPPSLSVLIALMAGALIGLINGFLVVKLKINSFLATLAMLIILRGVLVYILPQGLWEIPELISFLGATKMELIGIKIPVAIPIYILLFIFAGLIVANTSFGKNLVAVGSNPVAAYIAGINIDRIYILVFMISGVCAAFGGILLSGRIGSILNGMGEGDILLVFAGTVLGGISLDGGKGKITNALGGALLLTIISTILNFSSVSPFIIKAIQGLILLAAMIMSNFSNILNREGSPS